MFLIFFKITKNEKENLEKLNNLKEFIEDKIKIKELSSIDFKIEYQKNSNSYILITKDFNIYFKISLKKVFVNDYSVEVLFNSFGIEYKKYNEKKIKTISSLFN